MEGVTQGQMPWAGNGGELVSPAHCNPFIHHLQKKKKDAEDGDAKKRPADEDAEGEKKKKKKKVGRNTLVDGAVAASNALWLPCCWSGSVV